MKVKKLDGYQFPDSAKTKVVEMGNILETVTFERVPTGAPCRKISRDEFVDLRTGEVKDYNHFESRASSKESIRQTLVRIRELVNTNVVDPAFVRWITLTYAENMCDPERLYKDYKAFWMRFKRWCSKACITVPEYICVVEPQGRGAWHVHAFFIWPSPAPFLPNDDVARLWGQGFTKTKQVTDCDNVGAYFSAYLADMPLDDLEHLPPEERSSVLAGCSITEKEFVDAKETKVTKKFIKGGRLALYPPGMNIIRHSKGIKEPVVSWTSLKRAKEKASAATETFSVVFGVVDDAGKTVNTIQRRYYNTKRKPTQTTNAPTK